MAKQEIGDGEREEERRDGGREERKEEGGVIMKFQLDEENEFWGPSAQY